MKRISLKAQVLVGLTTLALLFVASMLLQVRGFERAVSDQGLLAELRAFGTRIADLERRGRGYAAVAPRDYASYERDVAVIHADWQSDMRLLQENLQRIVQQAMAVADSRIVDALAQVEARHTAFRKGLREKLGDNPAEPRLEWGAQFLESQAPELASATALLDRAVQEVVADHLHSTRRVTQFTWLVGALVLCVIALWFWRRVVSRIGRVSHACRAVAEGEFGSRAPVQGNDELTDLARAFNQLSSRTRVVLGVLDRLPDGASATEAFNMLWEESRHHLGHRWQGLFELESGGSDSELLLQREVDGTGFASAGTRFALNQIRQQAGMEREDSALWPDVRRHTLSPSEGRLLRELSRHDLRTLALVRLRIPGSARERLLAFAWAEAAAEETGVARFLGGLSRFFGRTLTTAVH